MGAGACAGWTTCGIISGLLLVLSITLLAICVNIKVDQSQVGVTINFFTSEISDPKEQGTYTILPGDTMVRFPRIYQQQNYYIAALTNDGIIVGLNISYQQMYNVSEIVPVILKQYDNETFYLNVLSNVLWPAIMFEAAKYVTDDFYNNRSIIENAMYQSYVSYIANTSMGIDIKSLQLVHIDFPEEYNNILSQKQIQTQNITTNLNMREGLLVQADTDLKVANQQAEIISINANNTANVNIATADTNYQIALTKWDQISKGLETVLNSFNNNYTQFFNYLEYSILGNSNSPIINFNDFIAS
jgi:regulator of protease activity HflC (stomatin/prohibitin superfamily)